MTWVISDAFKVGALDGGLAKINVGTADANGDFRILDAGDVELFVLQFSNPAFLAATPSGSNASASADAMISDTSVTVGTMAKVQYRDRDNAVVLSGTVGAVGSGADIEVSAPVMPPGTTEVECSGLVMTMSFT